MNPYDTETQFFISSIWEQRFLVSLSVPDTKPPRTVTWLSSHCPQDLIQVALDDDFMNFVLFLFLFFFLLLSLLPDISMKKGKSAGNLTTAVSTSLRWNGKTEMMW